MEVIKSGEKAKRRRFRTVVLAVQGALAALLLPIALAVISRPASDLQGLGMLFVAVTAWHLGSWAAIRGTLFDPFGMFQLVATAFNGGQLLLLGIGLAPENVLGGQFSESTISSTALVVMVGLSWLQLGAILAAVLRRSGGPLCTVTVKDRMAVNRTGWLLLVVSIVPLTMQLVESLKTVLAYGYMGLYQRQYGGTAESALQVLAAFAIPGAFFLLVSAGRNLWVRMGAVAVVGAYSGAMLFLGYRAHALFPAIACAWLWHRVVHPLRARWLVSATLVTLIVVLPLVRVLRQESGADRASWDSLKEAWGSVDEPLIATLWEMGGSMRTVAHTWELVPSVRDFDFGAGYGYALLRVIPNVFGDRHPSVVRGSPSAWLTQTVEPAIARAGGGLGYSFIADAYLNLGWFGPTLALLSLGYFIVWFETWAVRAAKPARVAAVAAFLPILLFFARAEADVLFRPLIWYSLAPLALVRLFHGDMRAYKKRPAARADR